KRAYCLKTQPATGETYPKSDLFNKAPGIYKNMGSNSVNIIINNTRKIIPPGKVFTLRGGTLNINIPGRSALLLGKTGEPPNYLYL
ncbi:hypothetical protein, partial [Escherichia coli]|uniref:hypothetical protein n=1 Tax=Escherichia coli TaxID=562 RepID=UPI003A97E1E5